MSIARQLCGRFVVVDMSGLLRSLVEVYLCVWLWVCLGHVKWRWCFGDKNTVLQGETHTHSHNSAVVLLVLVMVLLPVLVLVLLTPTSW